MRIDYHDKDGAMRSRRVIEVKSLWYIVQNAFGEKEKISKEIVLRSFPEPGDSPSIKVPSKFNRRPQAIDSDKPKKLMRRKLQ